MNNKANDIGRLSKRLQAQKSKNAYMKTEVIS